MASRKNQGEKRKIEKKKKKVIRVKIYVRSGHTH
jgi:hypothetical protein